MARNNAESAPSERRHDSVVEEVFLSPRVVDADAFARYAGQLRSLVEQSAAASDELKAAAHRAHEVFDALAREWGDRGSRTARVGEAMEAIERIETRLRDAGDVLDALRERRDARRAVEDMQRACAAQVEQIEARQAARVENVLAALQQRAAELADHETRVREAERESAERLRTLAAECETRLAETIDVRVSAIERRATELTEHERRVQAAEEAAAERIRALAAECVERVERTLNDARAAMDALHAEAASRFDAVRAAAEDAGRSAAEAAAKHADELGAAKRDEAEQRAEAFLRRVESLMRRAETIVGVNASGGHLPGSLGDLVDKGEKMRVAVATATQELAALRAQSDVARTELNRLDKRIAEAVESAETRLEALRRVGASDSSAETPATSSTDTDGATPVENGANGRDGAGRFVAAPD